MGCARSVQPELWLHCGRRFAGRVAWVWIVFLLQWSAAARAQSPPSVAWQPLGPAQINTPAYGKVTGRITSIIIDPTDATGNTVYVGTTGGGVWKSTNAAGPASGVTFQPLTDTLPVFNGNAGSPAIPSLSIGALSVRGALVLAGTGDPNDATDSFYGGGLLRSADAGASWTLINGSQDSPNENYSFVGRSFAGFAWSTISTDTVVAAVSEAAEGNLTGAASPTDSVMGLYYSTDAGLTWHMSTVMDGGQYVQRPQAAGVITSGGNAATAVVWNPVRKRFYAVLRYHGYYESADGATWTRIAQQPGPGLTAAACPTNPDQIGSTGCPVFRGALAVEPVSGDMYALTVGTGNRDQGLWRDVCANTGSGCAAAVSFSQQLAGASLDASGGAIPQGDYNLSLAAVPSGGDTLLFAGTIDLYRCAVSACSTMRNTTNVFNGCGAPARVAPAQHAIAVRATGTLPAVYVGNDGGLWRSTDGVNQQATPCSPDDAVHFENLNGGLGSLAAVQGLAQHPTDAAILLAGLGANGTAATTAATPTGTAQWNQLAPGEGGNVAIDPANPDLWYISTAAGVSIFRCEHGAGCSGGDFIGPPTIGPAQTANDPSLIETPWLLDPALSSNLILGTCRAWRGPAADSALWSGDNAISRPLAGPQSGVCTSSNAMIRSLAAGGPSFSAPQAQGSGSQVLYAGMAGTANGGASAGGHLFVTQAAQTGTNVSAWNDLTGSPVTNAPAFNPGRFDISSVAVDLHDQTGATVYVTVRGFHVPHVYRSTDAGAHWTNISRNLPDLPANSVVVDPNDANTIYVALDNGVYATSQVTACPTANCWNVYGSGLPNAPAMLLTAAPGMSTGDGRSGELRVATYGRGVWQIPLLTAAAPARPVIASSPNALGFGDQAVGTASTSSGITLTNTGNAPLTISRIDISLSALPLGAQAEFFETNTCTGAPVPAGRSCTVSVVFAPAALGSRSATMTIFADVSGGQVTIPLSGNGTPGNPVALTPLFTDYGSLDINATSAVQNVTVSNTATFDIALGTPATTGDYRISANTCTGILKAASGCTVGIVFTPTASGVRSGGLNIVANGSALTASLTGRGVVPATDALAPAQLTYAAQPLGTSSALQDVILTNTGDKALTLIAATTTGDFIAINSCGNSLAGHSTCTIGVIFQPTVLGQASGTLTVSDQYRAQSVALSGTGIAPPGVSLSPLFGMSFPATGVGLRSAQQTVTLTNNGGTPLSISTIAVSGDFAIEPGGNTCPDTLSIGSACTLQVAFKPTAGGVRKGALTISDSAAGSPQTLPLAGSGVAFSLAFNGSSTVTTSSGQNAVFPLLLTTGPAVAGAKISLTCAGAPVNSTCNITPATIPVDGNAATVSVTVLTGIPNLAQSQRPRYMWFALVLPVGLLGLRRRFTAAALLCLLLVANGCGAGRLIPSSGGPGSGSGSANAVTPNGTYTIVVTGNSAGLSRSVNLTLVVQ